LIHLDANSGVGRSGWDYRWQDIPALARDLETSPLYVFHYLKKWQRRVQFDSYGTDRARLYLDYVNYLDERGNSMSYARDLTELYRRFYRAEGYKSNAILKPIQVAARVILEADLRLFDRDGLLEAVEGRLNALVSSVLANQAEGRLPPGSTAQSRAEAVRAFTNYFVDQVFFGALAGDTAALRGKQLNLLKNACEAVYLALDAQEREARRTATASRATDLQKDAD
jgi:CRISPR-associated protein Csc3